MHKNQKLNDDQLSCLTKWMGRLPDFVIGSPDDPYMLRWWIIPRNRFFNIYLHQILKDDDDRALHDHPWWSVSFLLKGRLGEVFGERMLRYPRRYLPLFRSGKFKHRLFLPHNETCAWTLFITGPRYREWGFHCPKGWVHWQEFVGENKGEIGRGCGEVE